MRIRSIYELTQLLERQLSWRKRELTTIRAVIEKSVDSEKAVLLRGAMCLLYAHWEGFISIAAKAYVSFVVSRHLKLRDVTPNFVGLGLKTEIQETGQSNKPELYTQLSEKMTSDLSEEFNVDSESVINTRSNLKVDVLHDILSLIGIESDSYLAKRPIVDQRLVDNRNVIAHGGRPEILNDDFVQLHADIIQLMDRFRDDVEEAASKGRYQRNTVGTAE